MTGVKLLGKILLTGLIHCKTGMRIGGARETLEIGGVENIIVRDLISQKPYIPGSSLKGKLRSLLEKAYGKEIDEDQGIHTCREPECEVCRVFGAPAPKPEGRVEGMLTRFYVRDAMITDDSIAKLEESELETKYAEVKWENSIHRITSSANPRQVERVPSGTEFAFEIVYNLYEEEDASYLKYVFEALCLLEDDYLGGYGSRGYGKVCFSNITIKFNDIDDVYKRGNEGKIIRADKTPKELLKEFDRVKEELKQLIRHKSE